MTNSADPDQFSWLLRSQLIWIYIVCKDRVYPGSAGQGLISIDTSAFVRKPVQKGLTCF